MCPIPASTTPGKFRPHGLLLTLVSDVADLVGISNEERSAPKIPDSENQRPPMNTKQDRIKMRDGDAILVMVRNSQVIHHSWNMSLPHVEFVRRATRAKPVDAWVGTVTKLDGEVMGITSKYFYDYQLPAPPDVNQAIKDLFE